MKISYDFHVHSCLSPCGDDDMTPCNIAGMAYLAGIGILALTDHNSSRNCPSFFKAARGYGIVPIAGMEMTTEEDIHVVCLFEKLEDALSFNDEVDNRRMQIRNKEHIFGNQLIMNENDEVIGKVENLLTVATNVPIENVKEFVKEYNGVCYPAHIDRQSNGIIATLGAFPEGKFGLAELHNMENKDEYTKKYKGLENVRFMFGSDAHRLESLDKSEEMLLVLPSYIKNDREDAIRSEVFRILRGEHI